VSIFFRVCMQNNFVIGTLLVLRLSLTSNIFNFSFLFSLFSATVIPIQATSLVTRLSEDVLYTMILV